MKKLALLTAAVFALAAAAKAATVETMSAELEKAGFNVQTGGHQQQPPKPGVPPPVHPPPGPRQPPFTRQPPPAPPVPVLPCSGYSLEAGAATLVTWLAAAQKMRGLGLVVRDARINIVLGGWRGGLSCHAVRARARIHKQDSRLAESAAALGLFARCSIADCSIQMH